MRVCRCGPSASLRGSAPAVYQPKGCVTGPVLEVGLEPASASCSFELVCRARASCAVRLVSWFHRAESVARHKQIVAAKASQVSPLQGGCVALLRFIKLASLGERAGSCPFLGALSEQAQSP